MQALLAAFRLIRYMKCMTTPEETLTHYRARIDAIDEEIAQLLITRTTVIHEVAALKREHWPNSCHIRPGREGQMHRAILKRFSGTVFPPRAALMIWRQLIGASTHLESKLNVTVLEQGHQWLAREYFGTQIGITHASTIAEALRTIRDKTSNILILPNPTKNDWWRDMTAIHAEKLAIFAALPLIEEAPPTGLLPAVALAAVNPEPSGDDVSYWVRDGALAAVHGFEPLPEHGIFLGAHPRPIHLSDTGN